jgi:hypothetical protein
MNRKVIALALSLLFVSSGFAQSTVQSPFLDQFKADIAILDVDKNGELTLAEIEAALANPSVKGKSAAMVVAIRPILASKTAPKSLKIEEIEKCIPYQKNAKPAMPNYEATYRTALKRIETTKRDLFVSQKPSIDNLHQGRMGDCYLIATMGAFLYRHPDQFIAMFKKQGEDKAEVTFGNGEKALFDLPTDGELVIGSSTQNDGLWSLTIEKALASLPSTRTKKPNALSPFNSIGAGGSTARIISLFTGHKVKSISCTKMQDIKVETAKKTDLLISLRKTIVETLKDNRLVTVSTAPLTKQAKVPGISYKHAYAVLEYDEAKDMLVIWNPHGRSRAIKGEPGLQTGYTTVKGRFEVPLKDAVQFFRGFAFETTEPLDKKS